MSVCFIDYIGLMNFSPTSPSQQSTSFFLFCLIRDSFLQPQQYSESSMLRARDSHLFQLNSMVQFNDVIRQLFYYFNAFVAHSAKFTTTLINTKVSMAPHTKIRKFLIMNCARHGDFPSHRSHVTCNRGKWMLSCLKCFQGQLLMRSGISTDIYTYIHTE